MRCAAASNELGWLAHVSPVRGRPRQASTERHVSLCRAVWLALERRGLGAGNTATSIVSAVNVAEAGARLADFGASASEVRRSMALMGMDIVPFDAEQACGATDIRGATRSRGLSLGERACLQLAARRGLPALTADRAWAEIDAGLEVRLIRDT